jgi:hypothetical protein
MKSLKEMSDLHFTMYQDSHGKTYYKLEEPIMYISHRYSKTITVRSIIPLHCRYDILVSTMQWDDGSYCNPWKSSMVLHDILLKENRWFRAKTWFIATMIYEYVMGNTPKGNNINKIDTNLPPIQFA